MGKGTDKLYITHSEWASSDSYSASAGSAVTSKSGPHASFKRLPFNFCSLSLQPFAHPVCTSSGTIFDLTNILPWLKKHGTNPVDSTPLKSSELIKLHFAKNEAGEYVDPVTFKVFTDNTHIIALGNTGNVFAWDTVERLNVKAKMWRDLVSNEEFGRKDIITLQDPQNVGARDLSSFKYLKDGESTLTEEQERERNDPTRNVNLAAMGSSAKVLKAKEAVAKARADRATQLSNKTTSTPTSTKNGTLSRTNGSSTTTNAHTSKPIPYNAAQHTTGKAAASFTSTGLTPHTSGERALLSDEEYMLKRGRVKIKGYARLVTSKGDLNIELQTEYAPRAVWNFVQLSKQGYYADVAFHRNIRNFMIQGGDPTGTGKGGSSVWGKNFVDEFDGPLKHDARGVMSMANKGKDTNSSQFFITYRPASHLDRKHTIFGKVVGGQETLRRLEDAEVDSSDRPTGEGIKILEVVVFVDPFEEFQKQKREREERDAEREEVVKMGGTEDERVTWTGKRIRVGNGGGGGGVGAGSNGGGGGVGKYLKAAMAGNGARGDEDDEIVEVVEDEMVEEPVKKKAKAGRGFGNFDGW